MVHHNDRRPKDSFKEHQQQEVRLNTQPIRKVFDELDRVKLQQEGHALLSQIRDAWSIQDSLDSYDRVQFTKRIEELRKEIRPFKEKSCKQNLNSKKLVITRIFSIPYIKNALETKPDRYPARKAEELPGTSSRAIVGVSTGCRLQKKFAAKPEL